MLSFRVLFLFTSLFLFVASSFANQDNSRQNNTYTHEISDEKSGIRYTIETDSPSPPVLPEKASEFVPNSWIVQFKLPGLMQYRLQQKARLQSKSAQHAEQQLTSLVLNQANVIKGKQQSFIARARSERWIDSVSMRLTEIINAVVVSATETQIAQLRNHPDVAAVTQERLYQPLLHQSVSIINADDVWQRQDSNENGITGVGVKVAILDTGIDYNHPALGGCFGDGCKVAGGYDVYHDDPDPMDDDTSNWYIGHGTHVAGIVAANSESLKGVAPDATLYAYKVCAPYCPESDILRGLELAANPDEDATTDDAVDVINLSLGNEHGEPDDPIPTAINQLVEQGVVVTVAAGNDASFAKLGDIASAEKAITVGSSASDYRVSHSSSGGPSKTEAFFKPEIVAPGGNIESTCETTEDEPAAICYKSGTSMASPHIAGAAALLIQANPLSSPQEIKSRLTNTANAFNDTSTIYQGAGLVDVLAALDASATANPTIGYFGNVSISDQIWEKEVRIALSNKEDIEQQYSLSIESDSPAAINWDLLSESSVVLAAGKTTDVIVKVTVNRTEFDINLYEDLDLVASLVVESGSQSLNIPLIATKMMAFGLDYSSDYPNSVTLFNTEFGKYYYGGYAKSGFYLPIGNYNLVSHKETSEGTYVVFDENLSMQTLLAGHQVDFSKATNEISIGQISTEDDTNLSLSNKTREFLLEYRNEMAGYNDYFSSGAGHFNKGSIVNFDLAEKPLFFSSVSNDFVFRLSLMWTDLAIGDESEFDVYTYTDKWTGAQSDKLLNIDTTNFYLLPVILDGPQFLQQGVSFRVYHWAKKTWLESSKFPGSYVGAGASVAPLDSNNELQVFHSPLKVNLYGNARKDHTSYHLGTYEFNSFSVRPYKRGRLFYDFSFQENSIGNVWDYYYSSDLSTHNSPLFLEPKFSFHLGDEFTYQSDPKSINSQITSEVSEISTGNVGDYFSAYSSAQNIFGHPSSNQASEYELYCENELVEQQDGGGFFHRTYLACQQYKAINRYPRYLHDSLYDAELTVSLDTYEQAGSIEGAKLKHWYMTTNDKFTTNPTSANSKVNVLTSSNPKPENVAIEIKTDAGWQMLDVTTHNYNSQSLQHSAPLTIPVKGLVAHLRITVNGPVGDTIQYTLPGATFIGTDQTTIYTDDFDQDGKPDYKDMDDDNDEVEDLLDDFPFDATEVLDTDGDGIGNNADTDDDNDGVEDSLDAFPLDPTESVDTDGDGIGNNADTDDDNDGVEDSLDAFPLDPTESEDTDGDGIGNNADTDDDNDGVEDSLDAFPLDPTESVDTDGDGIGNNADTDDDNDGVEDELDAFPLDPTESVDTDSDGIGNNADTDDDNDGVEDELDAFPLDSTESVDTDGDGIGNNADTDDDNDGVSDANDAYPLDASRSAQPSPQTDSSSSSGGGGSLGQFMFMLLCLVAATRASNSAVRNL